MAVHTSIPSWNHGSDTGTVAVVGEEDVVTRRVAEVLSKHQYAVVHHPSPADLLEDLAEPSASVPASADREGAQPAMYVLNSRPPEHADKYVKGLWLDVIRAITEHTPRTPILVTVDDDQPRNTIKAAIDAGANEILSARDAELDEVVWMRLQSTFASAEGRMGRARDQLRAEAVALPAGMKERRVRERRVADRRGAAAVPGPSAAPGALARDVVEEWEDAPTAEEAGAARERVRAAIREMPSAQARGGPLADVLGVAAPGLRAESGRFDASKVAKRLGISLSSIAALASMSRQALSEKPDSARVQAALDPLVRVIDILDTLLSPKHVRAWLNAPHARLGSESPIAAITAGRGEKVARMLEAARGGGVD